MISGITNMTGSYIQYQRQLNFQDITPSYDKSLSENSNLSKNSNSDYKIEINSEKNRINQEYSGKQSALKQEHENKIKQLDIQYNREQNQIEQEYNMKKRSISLNLYI